jgi:hypothetical protein
VPQDNDDNTPKSKGLSDDKKAFTCEEHYDADEMKNAPGNNAPNDSKNALFNNNILSKNKKVGKARYPSELR